MIYRAGRSLIKFLMGGFSFLVAAFNNGLACDAVFLQDVWINYLNYGMTMSSPGSYVENVAEICTDNMNFYCSSWNSVVISK